MKTDIELQDAFFKAQEYLKYGLFHVTPESHLKAMKETNDLYRQDCKRGEYLKNGIFDVYSVEFLRET